MEANELRTWMEQHGYSARTLGQALDVHPRTVQRWRLGESSVPRAIELAIRQLEE